VVLCRIKGDFVLDGNLLENCTFSLDSESLHASSTAADAERSGPARSTRTGRLWGGLVGGRGHYTKVWWHWLDGVYCIVFLFNFFLIVVPSYLLVHSICTKKLD